MRDTLLHNDTFVSNQTAELAPGSLHSLDVPTASGGALDILVEFDVHAAALRSYATPSAFGIAARATPGVLTGAGLTLSFNVSTLDPETGTVLVSSYGCGRRFRLSKCCVVRL